MRKERYGDRECFLQTVGNICVLFYSKKTDQFTPSLELGVEVTILVCQTNRNWCFYSVIKHFFQTLQKEQLGNIENNDIRTTEATKVHITNFPTRKFSVSVVN